MRQREADGSGRAGISRREAWTAGLALAAWLVLLAFVRPVDHDEGQYVAAAVLARTGWPYLDFDYLQTPLQPLLLAPLTALWPGHALMVLRLANALMAAGAGMLLLACVGRAGGRPDRAYGAVAVFALSEPILFAASTARNDALPLLLACVALLALVGLGRAGRRAGWSLLLGLAIGSAAAAKISYLLLAASLGLVELVALWRGRGRIAILPCAAGMALALLPVGLLAAMAPERFWFDVIRFPALAPSEWYAGTGQAFRIGLPGRLLDFVKFLCLGPAPVLAAAIVLHRRRDEAEGTRPWLRPHLAGLIVAGVAAALLPKPLWRQYLVPLLPPLFLYAGLSRPALLPDRRWKVAALVTGAAGLGFPLGQIASALAGGTPLLAVEREAAALGSTLHGQGVRGPVATLSPVMAIDAGYPPDPRFAAGPFLFRTRDGLGEGARLIGVTRATFRCRLAAAPPAAILTGGEARASGSAALDDLLAGFARSQGYRPLSSAEGMTIHLPPGKPVASAGC